MAPRAIASLTVSFGLVSIPVKLFSATEASHAISFNLLHKADGSRLKQQYVVMIRPVADGLVMQQLLYAGEVRSIKEIDIPKGEVKDAELKLAQQLIEQQSSDAFDPAPYVDDVRTRIDAAIQKKVEGQEITMAEAPEGGAQVIDLMEALRASLERKAPAKARASEAEARKPPKRAEETESSAKKTAKK